VAELPLEKRYVWRVASTLKWAFADYDSANIPWIEARWTPTIFAG
jgi:hypothetical protein